MCVFRIMCCHGMPSLMLSFHACVSYKDTSVTYVIVWKHSSWIFHHTLPLWGKKHSHACFSLVMFHAKVMSLMFSYMTLFISMSTSYSSNILLSGFSSSSWVNFFYSSDRYNLPVPFTYMIMIRESFFYYLFFLSYRNFRNLKKYVPFRYLHLFCVCKKLKFRN